MTAIKRFRIALQENQLPGDIISESLQIMKISATRLGEKKSCLFTAAFKYVEILLDML